MIPIQKKSSNPCGIVLMGDANRLNIRQIVLENHIHSREDIKNKLKSIEYKLSRGTN